jgi:hypothetical protein
MRNVSGLPAWEEKRMLKQRKDAAQYVADRLIAAELAIDCALTCAAELSGSIPKARIDANLDAEIGQEALEQASQTFVSLVAARRNIINTHRELANTRDRIGLRQVALGGLMDKPPMALDIPHLAIVANDSVRAV